MNSRIQADEPVSLEAAISCMLAHTELIEETEAVELYEAAGKILAEDLIADFDQPPFPRAPVDGYAVQAADTRGADKATPAALEVIGELHAGMVFPGRLQPGQALRIMTGAPIPEHADSVIRQEDTDYGDSQVHIYRAVRCGDNYCVPGEDYQAGTCLLQMGTKINAVAIGIAASLGRQKVRVYRKPMVALFTSGDELVQPGRSLQPGLIYNSNLYVLGARLRELGITPVTEAAIADDEEQMAAAIRAASMYADVILTTGGVSVGKRDIMHEVMERLGAERLFWRIGIQPGTPTLCARYENTLLICLSGNPFGAIANVELLVRPVLAKAGRDESFLMEERMCILQEDFPKASRGRRFIRAICRENKVYLPQGLHASGVLSSMKGCNCMIDIPAGTEELRAGEVVCVRML